MSRSTRTELVSIEARCRCGAFFNAKNAQALAAKHHDKTNHIITVKRIEEITYGASGSKARRSSEQASLL